MLTADAASPSAPETVRLEALFDAHYPRLYRLARRMCATEDDALDLVQDTFVRAARAVARVPAGATAEEAWLVRVLVNLQRDHWRRSQVRTAHAATVHATDQADHEGRLVASAIVWRAVAALPPRRRAIVVLHELEELPVAAVGRMLGITAVTVRWHLFRARAELARALGAERRSR